MNSYLPQLLWNQLRDSILEEKCILFLGPGATVNFENPDRHASFFKGLAQQYPDRILSYHHDDGFLVYKNASEKLLFLGEIRSFYREVGSNPVLDLLAEIPFHVYITVTPDLSMPQTFTEKKLGFRHQFYATKIKSDLDEKPNAEIPLLYNLLGCESEPESLVTNHADFFDLIQSIYCDRNLPDKLVEQFSCDRTHNILFLGFEFDKWYFQLLLHLLRIDFDDGFLYAAADGLPSLDNKRLMEAQFRVNFVSEHIPEFVSALHSQFTEDQLRKPAQENNQRKYILPNILKLMSNAWTPAEFVTFCMIHFEDVNDEFADGQLHSTRLNLLLMHLRNFGLFSKFLDLARMENAYQYDNCQPYYES